MDLSPKLFSEIRFREQWRGYNPEEVDGFIKRVAAGFDELRSQLVEATERASSAERRLLERSDADEVRRTLVLAQRTAVTAMEEARADADRLVSEAEARGREIVGDAEVRAAELDADTVARRGVELDDLAAQRAALEVDIERLRTFVDAERERLAIVLRDQLEWLDSHRMSEPPSLLAAAAPEDQAGHEPEHVVELRAAEVIHLEPELDGAEPKPAELTVAPSAPLDPEEELRLARLELSDALQRAGVESEPVAEEPPMRPALFDDGAELTGQYDVLDDVEAGDAPEPDEDADEVRWKDDDDPFLAELRRAVVDTEPLGPRDHQAPLVHDLGDDSEPSGRFFRRGRRR